MDITDPLGNRHEGRSFYGPGAPDDSQNAARIRYQEKMDELTTRRDRAFTDAERGVLAETEQLIAITRGEFEISLRNLDQAMRAAGSAAVNSVTGGRDSQLS